MLQWSHDFSVMETRSILGNDEIEKIELQWSHDFSVMETCWGSYVICVPSCSFNGATTFQSWKLSLRFRFSFYYLLLQWSHDFSVMETTTFITSYHSDTNWLQWSHDFSVMETEITP